MKRNEDDAPMLIKRMSNTVSSRNSMVMEVSNVDRWEYPMHERKHV